MLVTSIFSFPIMLSTLSEKVGLFVFFFYLLPILDICNLRLSRICCRERVKLFNSLPNNKILDLTDFKVFSEDKLNVTEISVLAYHRIENHQHFSFSNNVSKGCFHGGGGLSLNVGTVW